MAALALVCFRSQRRPSGVELSGAFAAARPETDALAGGTPGPPRHRGRTGICSECPPSGPPHPRTPAPQGVWLTQGPEERPPCVRRLHGNGLPAAWTPGGGKHLHKASLTCARSSVLHAAARGEPAARSRRANKTGDWGTGQGRFSRQEAGCLGPAGEGKGQHRETTSVPHVSLQPPGHK